MQSPSHTGFLKLLQDLASPSTHPNTVGPKLDNTRMPPEEVTKNADSQAQTSGPAGTCILTEYPWSFWCSRFWETLSWKSWGEASSPGPLTFASLPPKVHSQSHDRDLEQHNAGQCQPDCSFHGQGPQLGTPFALWAPKDSCGGGGDRTPGGCFGGWKICKFLTKGLEVSGWRCQILFPSLGKVGTGSRSLKLSHGAE